MPQNFTAQDALKAFTALNDVLGLFLKVAKSEWGARIEFSGAPVTFLIANRKCEAQLSIPMDRIEGLLNEISRIVERKEVLLAQMLELVGKLNFVQIGQIGTLVQLCCAVRRGNRSPPRNGHSVGGCGWCHQWPPE